jgi:hypothetical protein
MTARIPAQRPAELRRAADHLEARAEVAEQQAKGASGQERRAHNAQGAVAALHRRGQAPRGRRRRQEAVMTEHPNGAYVAPEQTTRAAMTDLLSRYPGVIVNVVHGPDHACATLHRRGTQWKVTLERVPANRESGESRG